MYRERGCKLCLDKTKSRIETNWLDSLGIPQSHRNVYVTIAKKTFCVDGLDDSKKIVYEFYGDFFHGNPEVYNHDDINPLLKETFGSLYNKTKQKEKIITENGYKIISIWENDFKKLKKND